MLLPLNLESPAANGQEWLIHAPALITPWWIIWVSKYKLISLFSDSIFPFTFMKYICDKQMQIRRMYEETTRNLASLFPPHSILHFESVCLYLRGPLSTFADSRCTIISSISNKCALWVFRHFLIAGVNVKSSSAASNHCWVAMSCRLYLDGNIKERVNVVDISSSHLRKTQEVTGTSSDVWFYLCFQVIICINSHHTYLLSLLHIFLLWTESATQNEFLMSYY